MKKNLVLMENGFLELWFVDKFEGVMRIFPNEAAILQNCLVHRAVAATPVDGVSNSFSAL